MSTLLDAPEIETAVTATNADRSTGAALLEIQEVRERLFPLSVDAYIATMQGTPTELLRGLVIEKVKSADHDYYVQEVRETLERQISSGLPVFQERAFRLSDSVPQPDVSVLRGCKADYRSTLPTTALLAVEIAVSTLSTDRAKAFIYAEANIAEYWIVIPERKKVEVSRQPSPSGYVEKLIVTAPAVLHSTALPGVSVDLAMLFA